LLFDFVLPFSVTFFLKEEDVLGLSKKMIGFLVHEIHSQLDIRRQGGGSANKFFSTINYGERETGPHPGIFAILN